MILVLGRQWQYSEFWYLNQPDENNDMVYLHSFTNKRDTMIKPIPLDSPSCQLSNDTTLELTAATIAKLTLCSEWGILINWQNSKYSRYTHISHTIRLVLLRAFEWCRSEAANVNSRQVGISISAKRGKSTGQKMVRRRSDNIARSCMELHQGQVKSHHVTRSPRKWYRCVHQVAGSSLVPVMCL